NTNPLPRGITQCAASASKFKSQPHRFGFSHHRNPGAGIEKISSRFAIDRNGQAPIVGGVTERRHVPPTVALIGQPTKLLDVRFLLLDLRSIRERRRPSVEVVDETLVLP